MKSLVLKLNIASRSAKHESLFVVLAVVASVAIIFGLAPEWVMAGCVVC